MNIRKTSPIDGIDYGKNKKYDTNNLIQRWKQIFLGIVATIGVNNATIDMSLWGFKACCWAD